MYSNCSVVLENLEITYTLEHHDLSFLEVRTCWCDLAGRTLIRRDETVPLVASVHPGSGRLRADRHERGARGPAAQPAADPGSEPVRRTLRPAGHVQLQEQLVCQRQQRAETAAAQQHDRWVQTYELSVKETTSPSWEL